MIYIDSKVGYMKLCGDNKEGYINQYGEVVIEPKFRMGWDSSEGLARVNTKDGWNYIDKSGEKIFNSTFEGAFDFKEGHL